MRIQQFFLYAAVAFILPLTLSNCAAPKKPVPEETAPVDTDGDGIPDDEERKLGTDPSKADTDSDGLTDPDELYKHKTDPKKADTDVDGLTDGEEILSFATNALIPDTDGDTLVDGDEIKKHRTNPLKSDSDGDLLSDASEINTHKTNPLTPDTDEDGFADGQEIEMGTNPLDRNDPMFISDLESVTFGFDRSNLENEAAKSLARNLQKLQSNVRFTVQINAFTDHIGGDQYNLRLSKRRANVVFDFYVKNGIDESRITAQGLGKTPTASCYQDDADERGCRKDRRAESIPISPYKYRPIRKQL